MASQKEAVIHIDDLNVYARSYGGTWIERGVIARAYLEPLQDNDTRRGYLLDFATARESGSGKLGPRQKEIGEELAGKLRDKMIIDMRAVGWYIFGRHDGQDVWKPGQMQDKPKLSPVTEIPAKRGHRVSAQHMDSEQETGIASAEPEPDNTPESAQLVRMVKRTTRAVTFTCQWCHEEVTEQRYPSHDPLYCSKPACKKEATSVKAKERVAAWRKAHPNARRKNKA